MKQKHNLHLERLVSVRWKLNRPFLEKNQKAARGPNQWHFEASALFSRLLVEVTAHRRVFHSAQFGVARFDGSDSWPCEISCATRKVKCHLARKRGRKKEERCQIGGSVARLWCCVCVDDGPTRSWGSFINLCGFARLEKTDGERESKKRWFVFGEDWERLTDEDRMKPGLQVEVKTTLCVFLFKYYQTQKEVISLDSTNRSTNTDLEFPARTEVALTSE